MTSFIGAMDIRLNMRAPGLSDVSWARYARRLDFSHQPFYDFAAKSRGRVAPAWPSSSLMSGDLSSGFAQFGQDSANSGKWGVWLRDTAGQSSSKFLIGLVKDDLGAVVPGATVQAFRTSDDAFAGEGACDSGGRYMIATPFSTDAHYLVAYKPGSPDVAGTTVNTIIPTKADGS